MGVERLGVGFNWMHGEVNKACNARSSELRSAKVKFMVKQQLRDSVMCLKTFVNGKIRFSLIYLLASFKTVPPSANVLSGVMRLII